MFPTYQLREADRSQRKLPSVCLVGDLLEEGGWIVKVDGKIPSVSVSRFSFLQGDEWHPLTKLPVHYKGGYPAYTNNAVLRFDNQSLGNCLIEVTKVMEKKIKDKKYQQIIELQKPI